MRLASVPESLYERIGLTLGLVPTPFLDTLVALMLARTLMTAVKHGIFEVVARGRQSADKIAEVCDLDCYATRKLLRALEGAGYLLRRNDNYELTRVAQRWLTPGIGKSFSDGVLHRYLDAGFMNHYDEYVAKGRAVDYHKALTPGQNSIDPKLILVALKACLGEEEKQLSPSVIPSESHLSERYGTKSDQAGLLT
jgi:hypothetical protein